MRTGGMKTRGTLARPKKLDKVISLCWKSLRYRSRRREGARVELKLGSLCEWKWRRWLLAGVLWLAQVFMTSAYSMISSFFPTEAEKQGSNPPLTGVIISASPLCLVVCSPLFGYFLPRWSLKYTLTCGLSLVGGGFLMMRFLEDIPSGWIFIVSAILMRITEGIGWSMCTTITFSLLTQMFPNHVGTAVGCMEAATGLGYALGPPIGGVLYTIRGFKLPFTAVGVIILLFIPPTLVLSIRSNLSPQPLSLLTFFKLLRHPSILLLIFGNMSCFAGLTFTDPTFQVFLLEEFSFNQAQTGLAFLVVSAVDLFLALVVRKQIEEIGTRKFMISGFFISGIALFFLGPAEFISKPRLWITMVALVVLGIGLALVFVAVYYDLLKQAHIYYPDEDKAALILVVSSLSTFSTSLGEFVGPILGGALVQISDFPTSAVVSNNLIFSFSSPFLFTVLFPQLACHQVMGEQLLAQGFLLVGITMIDQFIPILDKLLSFCAKVINIRLHNRTRPKENHINHSKQ